MPYFLVDGTSIYEKLHQPKFHLLVFSDAQRDFQVLRTKLENKYAELVDFNAISLYPQAAKAFNTNNSFVVLLRPDNYVGFITTETSSDKLESYLNEFVGSIIYVETVSNERVSVQDAGGENFHRTVD